MDWNALFRKHADIIAGLAAWFIVGNLVARFVSPEWGIVGLAAGVAAYFLTQHFLPESCW